MVRGLICIFIVLSVSCGQQSFPDYENTDNEIREEQNSGNFHGGLVALNRSITGSIDGHVKVWIRGVQFYSKVVLKHGPGRMRYEQYIHTESGCPNQSHDLNGDGFLSVSEVVSVSGFKLIPLDRVLKTQNEGLGWFPTSSKKGSYVYSRSTAVFDLMKDLRGPDSSPSDRMVKLPNNEDLDLFRRTLILYAYIDNTYLPVACAEIRVSSGPLVTFDWN
jgi:hypothetical protein